MDFATGPISWAFSSSLCIEIINTFGLRPNKIRQQVSTDKITQYLFRRKMSAVHFSVFVMTSTYHEKYYKCMFSIFCKAIAFFARVSSSSSVNR